LGGRIRLRLGGWLLRASESWQESYRQRNSGHSPGKNSHVFLTPIWNMKLPSAAQSSAAGDLDFSIVLPNPFESDLDVPVARETRKLLSPLYQENAVFSE